MSVNADLQQQEELVHPFQIAIADSVLEDLSVRLTGTRWAVTDDADSWSDGVSLAHLEDLVGFWQRDYDWREEETRLNAYPQFLTEIDGDDIHFVWLRAKNGASDLLPIVLSHGWPGSFSEFLEVGELLATRGHDVVIPSLPGFGFPGPSKQRWDIVKTATAWATLMKRLGYSRYVAHGCDIGALVSHVLGLIDAAHVAGIHVTSIVGGIPDVSGRRTDDLTTKTEIQMHRYITDLSAYAFLHTTRPLSIGHALADSPTGLLSWIAERFHDWTAASQTGVETVDRTALITNTMIYWLNNTLGSSVTFYKSSHLFGGDYPAPPVSTTPAAVSVFAYDYLISDRQLAEQYNQIVQWTEHGEGGHFPALEVPHLLADDIANAAAKVY
ncbi:epoxide hydrolase family protein [Kribbella speibonae]|uniref:Epoxide hydrolase n=1 Tax=Kribbella speibonae TaxID=1572660 RepID=A0A4R0IXW0_9ACTN|nr:epoxide hydrolase family protein [Kribbella speibonae]TCC36418.1 epoxide hydrolase [Kribbella speibonae]